MHGVIKGELKPTLQAIINLALIDTLAACGDVNRNVVVAANRGLADLSVREWATVLPLLSLALAIGVYPKPYFAVLERPVLELVGRLAR